MLLPLHRLPPTPPLKPPRMVLLQKLRSKLKLTPRLKRLMSKPLRSPRRALKKLPKQRRRLMKSLLRLKPSKMLRTRK